MSGSYERTALVDHLVIDGESIVLYEDRFVRLGPLATQLLTTTESPQTIDGLSEALTDAFGAPGKGDAEDVTRAAVAALVAQGVLREVKRD